MDDLKAELAAQRIILNRLIVQVPEEQLRQWLESATQDAERIAAGGETIPPLSEAERSGVAIARDFYNDALVRVISHGSAEEGYV